MAKACPHCGSEVAYSETEARLLTGTCAGCGSAVTVVAGVGVAPGTSNTTPETGGALPTLDGPRCEECDSVLVIRSNGAEGLSADCPECETTLTFVLAGGDAGPEEARDEDDGEEAPPIRAPPRGRLGDRPRGPGRGAMGPAARPCRQCGAPLTFSTDEEGNLVGECASCGNRFTLPPRREGGYRDRGAYSRPSGGGRYPRPGGGRFDRRGGRPAGGRPYGGPRREYGSRDRDRSSDDPRRRRKTRRE